MTPHRYTVYLGRTLPRNFSRAISCDMFEYVSATFTYEVAIEDSNP